MKKILSLLLGVLLLTGCSEKALHKYSMTATDIGFDTVVSFTAYTENETAFNNYSDEMCIRDRDTPMNGHIPRN